MRWAVTWRPGWVTDVPVVPGTRNEREQALGSLSGGAAASALARQTIVLLDGPDASAVDGAVAQTAAAQISLWRGTTARLRERSNQSGLAVKGPETAIHDVGQDRFGVRLSAVAPRFRCATPSASSRRASAQCCSSMNSGPTVRSWMSTQAALRETGSRTHETPVTGRVIGRRGGVVRPVRSSSRRLAQRTAARCPPSSASISRPPRALQVPSSTAASAGDRLCVSAPITICARSLRLVPRAGGGLALDARVDRGLTGTALVARRRPRTAGVT
jgi:hypothetical protein